MPFCSPTGDQSCTFRSDCCLGFWSYAHALEGRANLMQDYHNRMYPTHIACFTLYLRESLFLWMH
jgi:hypothetical protein